MRWLARPWNGAALSWVKLASPSVSWFQVMLGRAPRRLSSGLYRVKFPSKDSPTTIWLCNPNGWTTYPESLWQPMMRGLTGRGVGGSVIAAVMAMVLAAAAQPRGGTARTSMTSMTAGRLGVAPWHVRGGWPRRRP